MHAPAVNPCLTSRAPSNPRPQQNRLFNGKAAEAELRPLAEISGGAHLEHALIRHNLVVFKGGEGALQVLPALGDVPPEARLNLIIHQLRRGDLAEAYAGVKDMEPSTPSEYILKAVVLAALGQEQRSPELLRAAQQAFQLVGSSASECDTIPGRQAMASCFFLLKQFDDVLVFLASIKSYFAGDDDFHWNHGVALAASGKWEEAVEAFGCVQSERYRWDYCLVSWLARCHIMAGRPRAAWDLYGRLEASSDSYALLQLIANDCYKQGAFLYAAKAFDVLERLDPNPEYWDGKRGAAVGAFQMVIAGREPKDSLREVIGLLSGSGNPQLEAIEEAMRDWAEAHGISC